MASSLWVPFSSRWLSFLHQISNKSFFKWLSTVWDSFVDLWPISYIHLPRKRCCLNFHCILTVYLLSWWWLLFISQGLYVLFLLHLSCVSESTLPNLRTLSSNDRRTEWSLQEIEFKTRCSFLIPSSVMTTPREVYFPTLCFSSFLITDAFLCMALRGSWATLLTAF